MASASETVTLYSADDKIVDRVTLPPNYMFGEPVRSICVMGKTYVEGGRADSFYGRGQFAEVVKDGDAS